MKLTRTTEEELAVLGYGLQACKNLEATMRTMGWTKDAAHFRQRQNEIKRDIKKLTP